MISGSPRLDFDSLLVEQGDAPDGRPASSISAETDALSCPARTSPVSARAPSARPERIEQDRLARAGLAGEHAKAGLELELEPLDEHDIVDGELPQHVTDRSP